MNKSIQEITKTFSFPMVPSQWQRFVSLVILCLLLWTSSVAQWATSPSTDHSIPVCPGGYVGIITESDGSSIFCGTTQDAWYVQKLSPEGRELWPRFLKLFDSPGSGSSGVPEIVSDGDGGVIAWWGDRRGSASWSEEFYTLYFSNALYMQRVDNKGTLRWPQAGIQAMPLAGGVKNGTGVSDGMGGVILYLGESEYSTTAFLRVIRKHTWLVRYDANGEKKWERDIDSANGFFDASEIVKLGNRVRVQTLSGYQFFDLVSGEKQVSQAYAPQGSIVLYKDSLGYNINYKGVRTDSLGVERAYYGVTQFNRSWDSLWYAEYTMMANLDLSEWTSAPYNTQTLADKDNGIIHVACYIDNAKIPVTKAYGVTRSGVRWGENGIILARKLPAGIFNASRGLGIFFDDGTAQVYDTAGRAMWDSNFVVISDMNNVLSSTVSDDNNGGAIIAFWTPGSGGIKAQHTGRDGKLGIIAKVSDDVDRRIDFQLHQNYPNPFNPTTTISFSLSQKAFVKLKIFDALGREVIMLIDRQLESGNYVILWNADQYASGVYYCKLETDGTFLINKMILIR